MRERERGRSSRRARCSLSLESNFIFSSHLPHTRPPGGGSRTPFSRRRMNVGRGGKEGGREGGREDGEYSDKRTGDEREGKVGRV